MRPALLESRTMKTETPTVKMVAIAADEAGQRIDNFLRTQLKGVLKSMIYRIPQRRGAVNKKRAEVYISWKRAMKSVSRRYAWRSVKKRWYRRTCRKWPRSEVIPHEDDHILVLNKPSGTAVHGGSGLSFGVIEGLCALRPEARFLELVHRLTGIPPACCWWRKALSAVLLLHEQLRDKGMQKDYLALVCGQWQSHTKVVQPRC